MAMVDEVNETTARLMHLIFTICDPAYAIFGGLYYVDKVYRLASLTSDNPDIPFGDYFKWDNNILITLIMVSSSIYILSRFRL